MATAKDQRGWKIQLTCPNCGQCGDTTWDRLDRPFRCRGCSKPFHVQAGAEVPGERPEIPSFNNQAVVIGPIDDDVFARAVKKFKALPVVAKVVFSLIAAILTAWGVLLLVLSPEAFEDVPPTLSGRATYVGQAIASSDYGKVTALAGNGSDELRDWLVNMRPKNWMREVPEGMQAKVSVKVLSQSARTGLGATKITVAMPLRTAVRPTGPQPGRHASKSAAKKERESPIDSSVDYLVYWKQSGDVWVIDGERTAQ